jgi:hypothetical protein
MIYLRDYRRIRGIFLPWWTDKASLRRGHLSRNLNQEKERTCEEMVITPGKGRHKCKCPGVQMSIASFSVAETGVKERMVAERICMEARGWITLKRSGRPW